jgi:hypothetical protein
MRLTLLIVVLLAVALPAAAGTLTEDFNAPFPAWESGWLGVNSNLVNAYVADGRPNTNPGVYSHYSATSTTGIGGFRFLGTYIEGWTSTDNVVVNQGETSVPEPAALGLIGLGLLALAGIGKRRAR